MHQGEGQLPGIPAALCRHQDAISCTCHPPLSRIEIDIDQDRMNTSTDFPILHFQNTFCLLLLQVVLVDRRHLRVGPPPDRRLGLAPEALMRMMHDSGVGMDKVRWLCLAPFEVVTAW